MNMNSFMKTWQTFNSCERRPQEFRKIYEFQSLNKNGPFIHLPFSYAMRSKLKGNYLKLIDQVENIMNKCNSELTNSKKSLEDEVEKFWES